MKRGKFKQSSINHMDEIKEAAHISLRPIVIDLSATYTILSKIAKKERASALALYLFYYHHGIIQKTNRVKCTIHFVQGENDKGLGWHPKKIYRVRKLLVDAGLLKIYRPHNANGSFAKGSYVNLVYYKGREAVEKAKLQQIIEGQEETIQEMRTKMEEMQTLIFELKTQNKQKSNSGKRAIVAETTTLNACSVNKGSNACSVNKKTNACKAPQSCGLPSQRHRSGLNSSIPPNGTTIFDDPNLPLKTKRSFADRMSKKLWTKVASKNQLPCNSKDRSRWTAQFTQMMREDNGRTKERVKRVLSWYIEHYGEDRIPEARCANTFRKKFCEIESAMNRWLNANGQQPKESDSPTIIKHCISREVVD